MRAFSGTSAAAWHNDGGDELVVLGRAERVQETLTPTSRAPARVVAGERSATPPSSSKRKRMEGIAGRADMEVAYEAVQSFQVVKRPRPSGSAGQGVKRRRPSGSVGGPGASERAAKMAARARESQRILQPGGSR